MSSITFTVIIPTRERSDVLVKSLQTATAQQRDDLEIIVSDNNSQDNTRSVVDSIADSRIRYINTGKRVSMSDNWEFALGHVRGQWVTVLGDDDGLLPGALEGVENLARETKTKAIRSAVCSYQWPSLTGTEFGRLRVPLRAGFEIRNSRQWLNLVLDGKRRYPELPMLYNGGFIAKSVLDQIKGSTRFYRSRIPDVYSGVTIAQTLETFVFSQTPFAINGASKHSTGTAQFSRKSGEGTCPGRIFLSEANIAFHPDIPLAADGDIPKSIHALILESYLQSIENHSRAASSLDFQRQLELILAASERESELTTEWASEFAQRHGLSLQLARRNASTMRRLRILPDAIDRITEHVNTYVVGDHAHRIPDVYAASLLSGELLRHPPSRIRNCARLLRRVVQKTAERIRVSNQLKRSL